MKIRFKKGIKLYYNKRSYLRLDRIIIALLVLSLTIYLMVSGVIKVVKHFTPKKQEVVVESLTEAKENKIEEEIVIEEEIKEPEYKEYRLTSYYTNDPTGSTQITGSGLSTKHFSINNKGWYTYKGKLVIAAATEELLRSNEFKHDKKMHTRIEGRHYFRYYEELKIIIDGIEYEAIILDSCGASMKVKEDRIDLFVSNKQSMIDRGYKGVNTIQVLLSEGE